jgi:hypothetical protein
MTETIPARIERFIGFLPQTNPFRWVVCQV